MKYLILASTLFVLATGTTSCSKDEPKSTNNNTTQPSNTSNKDYFNCTINGNGISNHNLKKEYDTKEVTATYEDLSSPTGKYLWLDFPTGIKNFKLSTHAISAGKYAMTDVAELDKHVVTFSNSVDGKFITFRSKSGELTITSISTKEIESGKGVANIEGSFSGIFIDGDNKEYTATGTFRSGENF